MTLGDFVTMDSGATAQAHLFQDRVRTTGRIKIGDDCSVGSNSIVLLGGELKNKVCLYALSLVMRHEVLPANTKWCGVPAEPYLDNDLVRSVRDSG